MPESRNGFSSTSKQMTLTLDFALNTVFRVESFSVDALDLMHDCFKIDGDAHTVYYQRQRCSPRSVISAVFIGLMPIFVVVRCMRWCQI